MQGIFLNTVTSCFAVTAIWFVLLPGEIFGWLGKIFQNILPEKLHDPVFACPICMFPWWGVPFYIFVLNHGRKFTDTKSLIFELLIVLFLGIGLQVLFTSMITFFREK